MRISFFVHDLSSNCVGRVAPIARALSASHEVEVLGLKFHDSIYEPYRDYFEYKFVPVAPRFSAILDGIGRLASMATGHVICAAKPLPTTLFPAYLAAGCDLGEWKLLAGRMAQALRNDMGPAELPIELNAWAQSRRRPVLLDVDDDELAEFDITVDGIPMPWAVRFVHPLAVAADAKTVVSRLLQRRYGGVLLRHGPPEDWFDPYKPEFRNTRALRRSLGLGEDGPLLLFSGIPKPHKGLPVLLEALQRAECRSWRVALIGPADSGDFTAYRAALGRRCELLGFQTHCNLPRFLAACTAVAIPQLATAFARAQVPAKLLDAMAMAKPVVASTVGDLPEILGGNRGYLFPPEDPVELAAALASIEAWPHEAAERGRSAREWYIREASSARIREIFGTVLRETLDGSLHRVRTVAEQEVGR
jgi:glycosyltransferase involved in cell wall biosynthesis